MHNIEKSAFKKGAYTGYGGGAVWTVRQYGRGIWRATPQGNNSHKVFTAATLRAVSNNLDALNKGGAESDYAAYAAGVKKNPTKKRTVRKTTAAPSARKGLTKRAYVSRPSQAPGHKAPSKRLQARRKKVATAPAGYFPNPKKEEMPYLGVMTYSYTVESFNKAGERWIVKAVFHSGADAVEYAKFIAPKHPTVSFRAMEYKGNLVKGTRAK